MKPRIRITTLALVMFALACGAALTVRAVCYINEYGFCSEYRQSTVLVNCGTDPDTGLPIWVENPEIHLEGWGFIGMRAAVGEEVGNEAEVSAQDCSIMTFYLDCNANWVQGGYVTTSYPSNASGPACYPE